MLLFLFLVFLLASTSTSLTCYSIDPWKGNHTMSTEKCPETAKGCYQEVSYDEERGDDNRRAHCLIDGDGYLSILFRECTGGCDLPSEEDQYITVGGMNISLAIKSNDAIKYIRCCCTGDLCVTKAMMNAIAKKAPDAHKLDVSAHSQGSTNPTLDYAVMSLIPYDEESANFTEQNLTYYEKLQADFYLNSDVYSRKGRSGFIRRILIPILPTEKQTIANTVLDGLEESAKRNIRYVAEKIRALASEQEMEDAKKFGLAIANLIENEDLLVGDINGQIVELLNKIPAEKRAIYMMELLGVIHRLAYY